MIVSPLAFGIGVVQVQREALARTGRGPLQHLQITIMGGHDHFHQGVFATGKRQFHITFQYRSKRLFVIPFWMLRRKGLDAVKDEESLKVHRLFGLKVAVIIDHRDAFGFGDEIRTALFGGCLHKIDDGLFAAPSFHEGSRFFANANVLKLTSNPSRVKRIDVINKEFFMLIP